MFVINPSIHSAERGQYFARLSNMFWRCLKQSGLVPEAVGLADGACLLGFGIGLTDIVKRATHDAAELRPEEFRAGRGPAGETGALRAARRLLRRQAGLAAVPWRQPSCPVRPPGGRHRRDRCLRHAQHQRPRQQPAPCPPGGAGRCVRAFLLHESLLGSRIQRSGGPPAGSDRTGG
ncbi:MAG: hypothetical protein U0531_09750 [Dehalococcoidia bacterium]